MKKIKVYIKNRWTTYGIILFSQGITFGMVWLVETGWKMALYICFISLIPVVIFEVAHLLRWINQSNQLDEILLLPNKLTEKEEQQDYLFWQYEQIIRKQNQKIAATENHFSEKQKELQDYYVAWTHQIKTPIAVIDLLTQVSPKTPIEEIRPQLHEIDQYTNMALTYAKLKTNQPADFVFTQVEIRDVITRALKAEMDLFIIKKISCHQNITPNLVTTDAKWLQFIIGQLLSNALKYTPEGKSITISSEANYIIIEDKGIGIKASDIPRITEKGFTGFNGRLEQKATGIGLYLCQKIADRLNITMEITSKQNQGTKVTLYLPEKSQLTKM
ncbi:MAG: sensor histidine kinase [Culicoidibacterales bacterium]